MGIKLIAELLRREFITQGILIEVFEELAESLEDLMKDSPKINESLAIFMAKLVKHAVWDNMTIKLLAGKNVGNGDLVEYGSF